MKYDVPSDQLPPSTWRVYSSHLGSYMRRWIARCPWGTLRVHHILRSDSDRDFHDHPFDFMSLILTGGYIEHRPGCRCHMDSFAIRQICGSARPCAFYGPGSIVRRKAEEFHRLELVNGPTLTFVVAGRYRRRWGFLSPAGEWTDAANYRSEETP